MFTEINQFRHTRQTTLRHKYNKHNATHHHPLASCSPHRLSSQSPGKISCSASPTEPPMHISWKVLSAHDNEHLMLLDVLNFWAFLGKKIEIMWYSKIAGGFAIAKRFLFQNRFAAPPPSAPTSPSRLFSPSPIWTRPSSQDLHCWQPPLPSTLASRSVWALYTTAHWVGWPWNRPSCDTGPALFRGGGLTKDSCRWKRTFRIELLSVIGRKADEERKGGTVRAVLILGISYATVYMGPLSFLGRHTWPSRWDWLVCGVGVNDCVFVCPGLKNFLGFVGEDSDTCGCQSSILVPRCSQASSLEGRVSIAGCCSKL